MPGAGPAQASGCVEINPTEQDGYYNSGLGSSIGAASANILYSSTALGINCFDDSFSVGIEHTGGNCGKAGAPGFAQLGWLKGSTGNAYPFTYTATLANGTGCGYQNYISGFTVNSSHTYQIVSTNISCGGADNYVFYYYIDGADYDAECSDWGLGNVLTEFGERTGTTNQMGDIGFWWIKYCNGFSCVPGTDPGAPPWPAHLHCGINGSGSCGYNGRVGWAGVPQNDQSWPDFNVCDNSLSTTTC